jgi:radical SAM protein with 4Fe4S-binding SPASM domain
VEGSWRGAFEAIARLRRAGIAAAVNTQINRRTLGDIETLLDRLVEAGVYAWQLQITSPFGNAADHPEILLQPYMMLAVFDVLSRVVPKARRSGIAIWAGNNLGYFGPMEGQLRPGGQGHYKGCAAGRFQIGLEADGAVKGCPSLGGPENVGGNVREHSLRELWERSAQLGYMRERTTKELWGYCAECYYADVCRGGCTATAEPLMGRPGNNPFCHHRALEMDRHGWRERIELVERAPGKPFDHGLYRIVREPKGGGAPIRIDAPRTSRMVDWMGPGHEHQGSDP